MTTTTSSGIESVPPAPVAPDLRSSRPLLGVALAVTATLLFACHDTVNKYLVGTYDVPLVAAIRYFVHAALMVAILAPHQGRRLIETKRTSLVVVRSICLVVASLFAGLALQLMPVAETTAIIYLSPILVVLLARPLLGEEIGPLGWLGAIGGFAGVLLIVRPGGGLDPLGVIYALCNIGVTVAYYLLSRILAKSERTLALLFYSGLVGAICFGVAMPWFWFGTVPTLLDTMLFVSLGVFAGLGHFCFTASNRYAPTSLLAPMTYSQLLWSALLGLLVFGQLPDTISLFGMVVIGLAGAATALRTRVSRG